MKKEDCYRLGQIRKPHGFKGDLTAFLDVDNPADYLELDIVFCEQGSALIPWAIESIELKNKGLVKLKLEGIDDEGSAKAMSGSTLWLPVALLEDADDTAAYLHNLIGYEVVDCSFGPLGTVAEVIEHPGNTLLKLTGAGNEKIVPYQTAFIKKTDKSKRTLTLELPEGFDTLWA